VLFGTKVHADDAKKQKKDDDQGRNSPLQRVSDVKKRMRKIKY